MDSPVSQVLLVESRRNEPRLPIGTRKATNEAREEERVATAQLSSLLPGWLVGAVSARPSRSLSGGGGWTPRTSFRNNQRPLWVGWVSPERSSSVIFGCPTTHTYGNPVTGRSTTPRSRHHESLSYGWGWDTTWFPHRRSRP